ncbi:MAG: YgiQ family radical SAM protein [Prevotella sp.]|nr:YgiQ family radical SAM protein [Candidatus Equicola stercoris]
MDLKLFLPTTKKEVELRGWDSLDIILFSADAYVDHPSFGAAVIGRVLEAEGYKVAIVPQPDWHGDYRDFKKLGRPRLFFGICPGCMDSMVNKYTANRRLRSEDAYSPDGAHDKRPEYPTIVYTKILKQLFPDTPVILGGIEASMRRFTHYDYWQDSLRPSLLIDSPADMLIYGMGEKPIVEIAKQLDERNTLTEPIPQTVRVVNTYHSEDSADIILHSHEDCEKSKRAQAENIRIIEEQSNMLHPQRLIQQYGSKNIVAEPPFPPMTTEELDRIYDLPYTRLPHPKYKDKRIPAYEMIRHSITMHRGCFGGCAFCTISAHQGKFVVCRSKESILKEVKKITQMPDFKGYVSDLGGPSANMYGMKGKDTTLCERCRRPSCINPQICRNLNVEHKQLIDIYRAADKIDGVKKTFVGSGVRYDLVLADKQHGYEYARELITRHVSGRLKVAPEHTSDHVLQLMRKPSFQQFRQFNDMFNNICRQGHLNYQLIPYFISSHPGCTEHDMQQLSQLMRQLHFRLEQVQSFTPTPMTISTEMYYTGLNPYTMEKVISAKTQKEKNNQHQHFFDWKKTKQK